MSVLTVASMLYGGAASVGSLACPTGVLYVVLRGPRGVSMGDVISVIKIYPRDVVSDFSSIVSEIRSRLPPRYRILRHEEEDLAYGYKVLRLFIVFPEETEGGTEELESILRGVDSVSEVEVELVTRVF